MTLVNPAGSFGQLPPAGGGGGGGGGSGGNVPGAVPLGTFDRPPNTAVPLLRPPRNATSWNPYPIPRDRPSTVQLSFVPIADPARGATQLPRTTLGAAPQSIEPTAARTSYCAGLPVPSLTCVNDSVTDESVAPATARSLTASGATGV